jgi:hypothetical protein
MDRNRGMGMPSIPGMGGGQQQAIRIDLATMPDGRCVKCDNNTFVATANIKMISPLQSPTGQWAHGVAQWWACIQCGYKFDPMEWIAKTKKEEEEKETTKNAKDAVSVIIGPTG